MESIKKVSQNFTEPDEDINSVVSNLGLTTPPRTNKHSLNCSWYNDSIFICSCESSKPVQYAAPKSPPYTHFITICFPTNSRFKIKHKDYKSNGMIVQLFDYIKFGACDQEEQYNFIKWKMNNHFQYFDKVDAFFEQTMIGNIHVHMRVKTNNNIKHIRCFLHRIYNVDSKHKAFVDIKKYDDTMWHEYENKKDTKAYQYTHYPHYII